MAILTMALLTMAEPARGVARRGVAPCWHGTHGPEHDGAQQHDCCQHGAIHRGRERALAGGHLTTHYLLLTTYY